MTALSQPDFEFVKMFIQRKAAIEIDDSKRYLAETRLETLARDTGIGDVATLLQKVRSEPHGRLGDQLTEAMTTNETSFFRDMHPFEAVRTHVLRQIIVPGATPRPISMWSAACSTGQEAYSLAILLRETLTGGWTANVLGTDINTQVLARANSASYTQLEVNRGLPAASLTRHFRQTHDLRWQVIDDVRRMVEFRQMNLANAWPILGPFDVVFLRNALIYLDTQTKKSIFERLQRVLRPGGHLFLGTGEAPIPEGAFERVTLGRTVCYRRWQGKS